MLCFGLFLTAFREDFRPITAGVAPGPKKGGFSAVRAKRGQFHGQPRQNLDVTESVPDDPKNRPKLRVR